MARGSQPLANVANKSISELLLLSEQYANRARRRIYNGSTPARVCDGPSSTVAPSSTQSSSTSSGGSGSQSLVRTSGNLPRGQLSVADQDSTGSGSRDNASTVGGQSVSEASRNESEPASSTSSNPSRALALVLPSGGNLVRTCGPPIAGRDAVAASMRSRQNDKRSASNEADASNVGSEEAHTKRAKVTAAWETDAASEYFHVELEVGCLWRFVDPEATIVEDTSSVSTEAS